MRTIIFNLFTALILLSAFLSADAQVKQRWITRLDSLSNRDEESSMAVDNSGNVYVTGASYTSFQASDYTTVKYNSSGVQLWVAVYNGPATPDSSIDIPSAVCVDNDGNVYVTGTSFGTGGTRQDYATIKYNSNGVQQWVQRYNGPGGFYDYATSIAVDDSGNVYVTGGSTGAGGNSDFTTIKYNHAGSQQWIKQYNGPGNNSDNAVAIVIDNTSHLIYVTGSSSGNGSNSDYATIKYSTGGFEYWATRYNGPANSSDNPEAISIDNLGNIYVTGGSWGGASNYDYVTIKYNTFGVQQWAPRYNGTASTTDLAHAISADGSGNIYVTGQSAGLNTSYDYLTIKYNSSGVQLWAERYDFGPGGNRDDRAFDLDYDNTGNVYVTGFSSSSTFNDYATIKYNSNGNILWTARYNGSGSNDDQAASIEVDNSGNVLVSGKSWNSMNNYDFTTIKYSQAKNLSNTALIQGFYDNFTNSMVTDVCTIFLRSVISPYSIVDSSSVTVNSSGNGLYDFYSIENSTPYFIVVKHRNSIETWSAGGNSFTANALTYDFTSNIFQAFGSNMTLKGNKFCIYNGDVNQEGNVDLTDIILIFNDASNFVTGYLPTDVNGDNFTDISDIVITYNNSINFVSVIRP